MRIDAQGESDRRDFFISYTETDEAWAEWIAWELEAAGYTVVLRAWDLRPGQDFVHLMQSGLARSDRVLVVLSQAYLKSKFAVDEWRAAFAADPSGERDILVPVRVEAVTPPGLMATRVYIDLVGADDPEEARARLLNGIAGFGGTRHPTTVRFPGHPAPAVPSVDPPALPRQMRYEIFLSSTFADLRAERIEVTQALLRMGRCIPAGMELFGASSMPPWNLITRALDVTDYFVLVLGHRYGSVPPGGEVSYTEREYRYAVEHDIPVLAFVTSPSRTVEPSMIERDPAKLDQLERFKSRVLDAHVVPEWSSATELATLVTAALWREFVDTPRPGWVRGTTSGRA